MSRAYNRTLSIALRRLRLMVVLCCSVIALSLGTQVVIWSLASFTDLRFKEVTPEQAELIIRNAENEQRRGFIRPRTRREPKREREITVVPSGTDTAFTVVFSVAHSAGLITGVLLVPLIGMGVMLGVPAGAPNVERALTALAISIVFVLLALPLGGWCGLAWSEGTLSTYVRMTEVVDAAKESGFTLRYWTQFLALPAVSVVAFIIVGFRFSAALEAVILKSGLEDIDPELEKEASGVKASSLHGTGRTAGALKQAMKKSARERKTKKKMSEVGAGDLPKRLI